MKHVSSCLFLVLVLVLSNCTKQSQTDSNLPIEKAQLGRTALISKATLFTEQKDTNASVSPIPQKFFDEVGELVAPVQEKLNSILEKIDPELNKAYQEDAKKLGTIEPGAEKDRLLEIMNEKYHDFMLKGWAETGIDEKAYKEKITGLLPEELRGLIRFEAEFLIFYFDIARPYGSMTWMLPPDHDNYPDPDETKPPTPPTPPTPPCTWGAGNIYYPSINSANAYTYKLMASYAAAYGIGSNGIFSSAFSYPLPWGQSRSGVSLTGNVNFANAACTQVKVHKEIIWNAAAYAFTFYGHASVGTAEYNTGYNAENITVVVPVIGYFRLERKKNITEDYTITKTDSRVNFGASIKTTAFSEGVFSNAGGRNQLYIPKWTITEMCCQ
ncbi:hypothetical protein [Niabella drilacis]|uniref:Uncharacterized protein n=1 Tax=Niabella drilacis (strain DSM 25811 / CCM 8410 / CCUG 62505 / LMG 26954 / E90) TaxID=1285928 RepID=A0A1G6LAB2_NIADE|nr:hypothetical protein [Niabella drilacis]SDC40332.1 hypothetical protein SAMN04487894_102285 [Niabella drilacis]